MSDSKEEQNLNDWAYERIAYLFKPKGELIKCFKYKPETISIGRHVSPSECLEISNDLTNSLKAVKESKELKE